MTSSFGDGVIIGHGKSANVWLLHMLRILMLWVDLLGSVHAGKIAKIQDMALKMGAPIIGIIDSGGARIQEGVASLAGYAGIFFRNVKASGVIPQISVIMGPAAGGAVYSPSITDFVFMTNKTSYMFVTGPNVVKEVLNQDVSFEDLGGAEVHARKSGIANMIYENEENTLFGVRKMLLSYLPSNNLENPPSFEMPEPQKEIEEKLRDVVPDDANKPYDVKDVINLLIDKGSFLKYLNYLRKIS
jgi:acetyl-CoA carboxylase carboxyltransferase component